MNVEFTGRHFRVRDDIRELALGKLERIATFIDEPIEARFVLEADKRRRIAELVISHRHGTLTATEESEQMEEALHAAAEKVEKQARRARKKFSDTRRRKQRQAEEADHWPVDVLTPSSVDEGSLPAVIKTSRLSIKPMSLDEAALELKDSKNDFFVFLDSATDKVSVLYRRRDQNYGLIAPEF